MTQTFPSPSVREALRLSFRHTREHLRPLLYLGALNLLLSIAQEAALHPEPDLPARPLLAFVLQLLQVALWLVMVRWALALSDRLPLVERADLGLFRGYVSFALAALAYGLIVGLGLVLFVVPGLLWATRYAFATTLVVDRGLDPLAALRESARLTHGARLPVLGFLAAALLMNVLGAAAFGVGLVLTVPISTLAHAELLRQLQARTRGAAADHPTLPLSAASPA